MIVLAVGMPRAGSGWHYNLINDLMRASGAADAGEIRRKFHLESILTEVNCNIGVLSPRRLAMVALPGILGNTFVIKAHSAPSRASRLLSRLGLLRIAYIYRDPRDAMLSAFEYGRRALQKGRPNAFSHLVDFETSLAFILEYVAIWEKWMVESNVLLARYEDLLTHYDEESRQLVNYLRLDAGQGALQAVLGKYRPEEAEGKQGTHFFKGQTGRFRQAYSADQQRALAARLGAALVKMGYEV